MRDLFGLGGEGGGNWYTSSPWFKVTPWVVRIGALGSEALVREGVTGEKKQRATKPPNHQTTNPNHQ